MPHWAARIGIVVILVSTLGGLAVRPAAAAAPWIMMVTGDGLSQPVYITSFVENAQILASLNTSVNRSTLQDRPALQLWLYWGPTWEHYMDQGGSLSALRTDEANQHGTFYPITKTQPAVMELKGSGRGPLIVDQAGLAILAQHGIPTTSAGLLSRPTPPDAGSWMGWSAGAGIAVTVGIAAVAIGRRRRKSVGMRRDL